MIGPIDCDNTDYQPTTFSGVFDKNDLPKGNGRLFLGSKNPLKDSKSKSCFALQPGIESLNAARFFKGQPNGKGGIKYKDNTVLEGNFVKGKSF